MAAIDKPTVACEITPERVIAARAAAAGGSVDTFSSRTLAPGALLPSLGAANVADAGALRQAISDALAVVAGRSREIIAVVPDAAVRIVMLDFEELPERRQEADGVVRFRLKKSLPFDADQAALSYDVRRDNGVVKVLAAVSPAPVLEEYETAFRNAGFNPGVVVPSMLAALGPVDASQPTLVLKVDPTTTSVAIVQREELLLYRTLENPRGSSIDPAALADDIYPSLVFLQDNHGVKVERILLGGLASADALGPALESQTGARVSDLVSLSQVGEHPNLSPSMLAGVVGALA